MMQRIPTPTHEGATVAAAAVPLPLRLRLETRELHAAAERSGAMGALLRGELALPAYRALLRNLLAIYIALEVALDTRHADPRVAPMRMPALYRAPALSNDLASIAEVEREAKESLLPAAADYADRLAQMALQGSPALVAHAYVRYLGDLNGGQTLKRLVARSYGAEAATAFYEFGSSEQVAAHVDALRAALAAVPSTPAEDELIVAEARWAFEQHIRLFEQLMAHDGAD